MASSTFIVGYWSQWCPTFYFPKSAGTEPNINAKLQNDDMHAISSKLKLLYDLANALSSYHLLDGFHPLADEHTFKQGCVPLKHSRPTW